MLPCVRDVEVDSLEEQADGSPDVGQAWAVKPGARRVPAVQLRQGLWWQVPPAAPLGKVRVYVTSCGASASLPKISVDSPSATTLERIASYGGGEGRKWSLIVEDLTPQASGGSDGAIGWVVTGLNAIAGVNEALCVGALPALYH
jgi:hypothetical protein